MGPWTHTAMQAAGFAAREALEFGLAHARGQQPAERTPVRRFMMGQEQWRDFDSWPPQGYSPKRFHLQPEGRLALAAPTSESAPNGYRYDPADPTSAAGGVRLALGSCAGPVDNTKLEARADVLTVPAVACSVLAGRLVGTLTDRFAGWQVSAGLAALTVVGVLVVAIFTGPVPIVVGTALTVCGFAGAQAVLVSLAPGLVAADDRDTAQGLLNFVNALGGGIGPAAVAGLSGIVPGPKAPAVLVALPLAGLVLSLPRRPTAERRPDSDATRGSPR